MNLVAKGSQTANVGFRNKDDIVKKFNDWKIDIPTKTINDHFDLTRIKRTG